MDYFIALIDALGMMGFLLAFRYAWMTVPRAGESRSYWIIFSFGMLLAFGWALSTTLEWMGLASMAFDEIEIPLLAAVAVNLSLAAILSWVSLARPFD